MPTAFRIGASCAQAVHTTAWAASPRMASRKSIVPRRRREASLSVPPYRGSGLGQSGLAGGAASRSCRVVLAADNPGVGRLKAGAGRWPSPTGPRWLSRRSTRTPDGKTRAPSLDGVLLCALWANRTAFSGRHVDGLRWTAHPDTGGSQNVPGVDHRYVISNRRETALSRIRPHDSALLLPREAGQRRPGTHGTRLARLRAGSRRRPSPPFR